MLSIVVGSIWTAIAETRHQTRCGTARFRLDMLRSQITMYRLDHAGMPPSVLEQLTLATDAQGRVHVAPDSVCGPYLERIPANPFNRSAATATPLTSPPRQTVGQAGWLYDPVMGEVWLNHPDFLSE
jgi:hypothetical protein